MVWIVIACMTLAAVICVVWPLSKPRGAALRSTDGDVGFYRDQLRALERDVAEGAVTPVDAVGSRTEIARRLIAAADRPAEPAPPAGRRHRLFAIAVGVAVAIPLVSLTLYARLSSPGLADRPLVARLAAPEADDLPAAIARIETHLLSHPDDGRGFALLAPIYGRLGRPADSARAYGRALALLGETAERRSAYGEALMQAGGGTISADAEAAFAAAVADDPKLPQARFYLGVAAAQAGDAARARALWTGLVADADPDAPWLPMVRARIATLAGAPPPEAPGGEAAKPEAAAIAALPAAARLQAIHGMVDGLASRLQADGRDAEGWLKLVRAYAVLGETARARDALTDARRNLAADTGGLARLEGLARELGLEGQG